MQKHLSRLLAGAVAGVAATGVMSLVMLGAHLDFLMDELKAFAILGAAGVRLWLVKADVTEPQRWALALTVLLGFRAWWTLRTRLSSRF